MLQLPGLNAGAAASGNAFSPIGTFPAGSTATSYPSAPATSGHPAPQADKTNSRQSSQEVDWDMNQPIIPQSQFLPMQDNGQEPLIAAMVDNICTQMELSAEYIAELHAFAEFTQGLSLADRIARIYTLSAIFKVSMSVAPGASQFSQILDHLKEIKEEFEAHFLLSEDHKTVVQKFAHDEVYKAKRMDFMTMHVDVLRIMSERKDLGFNMVFKSPAREAILTSYVKSYCSGIRNQFRQSLRDGATVGHKSAVNITKFTTELAEKYKQGGAAAVFTLDNDNTVKCALLRHIALQNKAVLGIPEPGKQGARGDSTEPADAPAGDESAKRKRQHGRPKDDDHFWSIASKFLEDKEKEFGKPFSGNGWSHIMIR